MGDVPDETALPVDLPFDLFRPDALRLMGESSESEL